MIRPASPRIVLAGLIGGAALTSGIALTATSGWLIVRAAERPVILTLMVAIVGVRTFGIARPLLRYVERLLSHDAALADLRARRVDVYDRLIPLTPARLGRGSRADILTGVVDDLTDIVDAQVRVTVPAVSGAVAGLLAAVLTAFVAPAVGLLLAGLLLVIALAAALAWRLEMAAQPGVLAARTEVMRVSDLVARQADDLRAIGAEAPVLRRLDAAHEVLRQALRRQSTGRAIVAAIILVGTGAATVAAAALAARSSIGAPLAALLVVVPVATGDALAPLAEVTRALARAQAARARLDGLLSRAPAVSGSGTLPVTDRPDLHLEAVTARWEPDGVRLGPFDLDVPAGRRVAIVGPNGSGKSTLLAVLARQLDPDGGRYDLSGTPAEEAGLSQTRARLAIVDDEPHIFATSLRENLRLATGSREAPASDEDLVAALHDAGLGPWFAGLPRGLDTALGTGGRGVSGGERARLAIARALVSDRPILLLDEPVAHLDHATAVAVLSDLTAAARRHTVVMVTHRPEGLDGFDEIVTLSAPASKE